MNELIDNLVSLQGFLAAMGALGLIEFTPIKLNPISFVVKRLGNALNSGMYQRMDSIENGLKDLNKRVETVEREQLDAERMRYKKEILDFAPKCKVYNNRLTKEDYDHIFQVEQKYHEVIKKLGVSNGQVNSALEVIKEKYKEFI